MTMRSYTDQEGRRWRVHHRLGDLPRKPGILALLVIYGDRSIDILETHRAENLLDVARRRLHTGAAWIAHVVAGRGTLAWGVRR